ncbi:arabinose efflux permease [Longilinea arvoryzae]|uniref:Arabinose efflux permease n=1 Tax=Longilinea arvoryzae TaxID=360412 RepID=A0A0S7BEJ3_9CHLR|nr:MFS transporter [Longilinea arvoryzae]GAP12931.1 arabinose efflux permease [Longilinea arvoryzae]
MKLSKPLRYALFGLLYFTQGTILSYFTALNALYLLERGLTMTNVGIFSSIALIPFVIKILFGLLSDRVSPFGLGHRKPYIFIGLTVQMICLIIAPFIDPKNAYWGFVALAFVLQMGMALYDTCTDGLALDTTPEGEKGTIQGFMVGGRAVGVIVTASLVGLLAERSSWQAVFWVLAGLTLLPLPLLFSAREPAQTVDRNFDWKAFKAFKKAPVLALAGVGFLFFLIVVGANQLVNPFLQKRFGIELSTAGLFTTVWGIGVVLGGAVGGFLIDKVGRRNGVRIAMLISVAGVLALAGIPALGWAWPIVALFGIAYGTYQTVYFALAMAYTEPRIAASMFSILMAVTNVGQGVGLALGGLLADRIDYPPTFIIFAAMNLLAVPLLPIVFEKVARKATRHRRAVA